MSHNRLKVQSKKPNAQGEVSVDISELGGVSVGTPTSGEVLTYNSSTSLWESQTKPAASASSAEFIFIGKGESNDWLNSGSSTDIGDGFTYRFYDTSPINNITGASLTTYLSTNWINQISLPQGTYSVLMNVNVVFSASGYVGFQIKNLTSNSFVSEKCYISGDGGMSVIPDINKNRVGTLTGIFTLAANSNIAVLGIDDSNADGTQGNFPSESSSIYIEKIAD